MNKKHIHAENMKLYAEDAMETDKPWERWEVSSNSCTWFPMNCGINWNTACDYRRKHKHREFLDAVKAGQIDGWEARRINWDTDEWGDPFRYGRITHIQNYPEQWETRRKPEPEELLPAVGTPVWVRDSTEDGWQIAMFSDKVNTSSWPYRVWFSDYTEEGCEGFKYMTTENPYKLAV